MVGEVVAGPADPRRAGAVGFRLLMRMRRSLAELENAFVEDAWVDRARAEESVRRAIGASARAISSASTSTARSDSAYSCSC